jgi:hypothetical protein
MLPLPLALLHQLQSLLTIKKVNIMPLWKDSNLGKKGFEFFWEMANQNHSKGVIKFFSSVSVA